MLVEHWKICRKTDDATQSERDMAQERLDRATKNRQRVRNKHKQENKNRKD